jgi:WXG100 family type VII secretion target
MATRFMTDPHEMRAMAGCFELHAQTVEDEARRMWASSQNIAGAGWSGQAQATSYDTMGQMNQVFNNIVNMLHGVRDGLIRDANNYEQQEQASQSLLGFGSGHETDAREGGAALMETPKAELGTSRHEAGSDAQLAESFLATHGDSFPSSMFSQQGTQPQEPATVNEDLHSEHVLIATDTENQSTDDSVSQGTLTDGEGASHSVQVALETETGDASKDAGSHSEQPGIVPGEDIMAPAKAAMETAKAFMEPANPQEGANLTAHDQLAPHSELTMSAMFGQQDSFPSSMFANVGTPTQVPNQALAAEQLPAQTPATESPHPASPEVESLGNAVPNINPVVHHGDLAP